MLAPLPADAPLFGIPLGPELVVLLLLSILLFFLVVPLGMAYWVYADATSRGRDDAAFWALAVVALTYLTGVGGVLALVVYVWERE